MKEDKSASQPSVPLNVPGARERIRRPRSRRSAPRTEFDYGPTRAMAAETQKAMNALLADEFVLYVETLNFHWNVKGMQFHSLHIFFETLYEQQAELVDDIAEKVRSLGGIALASLKGYLAAARIGGWEGEPPDPRTMVARLAQDHRAIIAELHEAYRLIHEKYDDPSTENFLADLLEKHEKTTWMLQAHLDRELG